MLGQAGPEELLFLTADRDIPSAFAAWGLPQPLIRTKEDLRPTLFDVTIDHGQARTAIVRYLLERLPADALDHRAIDVGPTSTLEEELQRRGDDAMLDIRVYGVSVTRLVALAGIEEVTVENNVLLGRRHPHEDGTQDRPGELGPRRHDNAYATVYFLAEAEATIQDTYDGSDSEVSVVAYDNVLVRAELSFLFVDGVITAPGVEREANVSLLDAHYSEPDDALQALQEVLERVPGLELDRHLLDSGAAVHAAVAGLDAQPAFRYNGESWWGGTREGFQGPDGYVVELNANDVPGSHGVWSVSAWLVHRLDWARHHDGPHG
ncbi:hypothetical protein [Streptomyces ferrugineus]|uniref:hypothetical protein n=1 Tax=Streptomyces ferrugineus TaxID=1413221 RepID=UPI001D155708|nr:hypothetical protein [Streptomyces ferrugineus]